MKLALIFFGQPRFIENKNTFDSHIKWIFDEYDVDVYSHCWWSSKLLEYDVSDWVNTKCEVNSNPIEIIKKQYNPLKLKVESPKKFEFSEKTYSIIRSKFLNYPWSNKTFSNINSHLYSIEQSAKLIETPENYDFIIVSRYDNYIHNFPDLHSMNSDYFYLSDHHTKFPDLMYIFGSKFIRSQFTYSSIDFLFEKYFSEFWEPSAECLKKYNYLNNFSPDKLFPIHLPVRVVRDSDGYGDMTNLPIEYLQKIK